MKKHPDGLCEYWKNEVYVKHILLKCRNYNKDPVEIVKEMGLMELSGKSVLELESKERGKRVFQNSRLKRVY